MPKPHHREERRFLQVQPDPPTNRRHATDQEFQPTEVASRYRRWMAFPALPSDGRPRPELPVSRPKLGGPLDSK
jgi:hypothetical protein